MGERVNGDGVTSESNEINASVAYYTALDADSITIEFWARTAEGTADLVSRREGSNGSGFVKGLTIFDPDGVDVKYKTDLDGTVSWTNLADIHDGQWYHLAFTFDSPTGTGKFYVDGDLKQTHDGTDGAKILWPTETDDLPLAVGVGLDGGSNPYKQEATMDELRVSDVALDSSDFLYIPEPCSIALMALGMGVAVMRRRR